MSWVETHGLVVAAPPLVPLAWNFVVPAFLGFLVGSTYVLAFGLVAALVVWFGANLLFALWLVTGLYPFNRLALVGYAVSGALVARAAYELVGRWWRRLRGRLRLSDLTERDRAWAGDEALALMRLARSGARVVPGFVDRRAPGRVRRPRGVAVAGCDRMALFTRHPRGGPVHLARVERPDGDGGIDLDRIAGRAAGAGPPSEGAGWRVDECLTLLDRAEASGIGPARLVCEVTPEGPLVVAGYEAMEPAGWTGTWLAGAGVDLAADAVSPLERDLVESAWGWDRLLVGRRAPADVRFVEHRPYVSFEAARGGTRDDRARDRPVRWGGLGLGTLVRDLAQRLVPARRLLAARSVGPREAVERVRRACERDLAPMHAWSALALRAVRWTEAVIADPARRSELLRTIQAPEARSFARISAELAEVGEALSAVELRTAVDWGEIEEQLAAGPTGAARRAMVRDFLARHGHRGSGERTLAGARWSDGPGALAGAIAPLAPSARAGEGAGEEVRAPLSLVARLDPLEWWIGGLAALGAFAMSRRVAARERATRVLADLRTAVLGAAEELVARGAIARREDLFLLTVREWLVASEAGGGLADDIDVRRSRFEAAVARVPGSVWIEGTGSIVGAELTAPLLRGIAASAGVVRGRAVLAAAGDLAGGPVGPARILVADDANPALAALLGSVAALVCERGGLLSHLAIVARELGVPAVMGVPGAAGALAAGAWIEVDGGLGEVRVLAGATDSPAAAGLSRAR